MSRPVLYGPAYSVYTRAVMIALHEKKVAFDHVSVDLRKGEHKQPEHLARHPFGKVPAFLHNGFAIYESEAILRYLDDAFPGPKLAPNDIHRRTRATQIYSVFAHYAAPIWQGRIVRPRLLADPAKGPDEAAIAAALPEARHALKAVEALMLNPDPFLTGRTISFADCVLAPALEYLANTPEGPGLLADVPRLAAWLSHMRGLPSFAETAFKW